MKKTLLFAVIAGALALAGCAKDTELYNKVDKLDERVSKLEEQVKELNEQTVPGIRNLVAAIQGNVYATSVVDNGDGYTITFSNGTVATIKNGKDGKDGADGKDGKDGKDGDKGETGDVPVISCAEFEGEFYWTVNGEFMTDADGNKIPVHKALPTFKIIDGKWNVSYDNGTTWEVVPQMGESETIPISIVDGEESFTIYIGEESYVIKKEVAFYLVFDQRTDLGVVEGQTSSFPYTIKGVAEGDEVEVDVLNVIGTWDAEVVATDNKSGNVKVTNNGGDAKVFVYAANGKGKTDIKSLVFEGGELTATMDANSVKYEGGEVVLTITTNVNYEVKISEDATWLTVAPETKATHTDNITLVAEANTTFATRTATVTVVGDGINKDFEVIQEAAPKPELNIDITIENIATESADITFTPSSSDVYYIPAVESPGWVEQYDTPEELAAADVEFWLGYLSYDYEDDPEGCTSLEEYILKKVGVKGEYSDTFNGFDPGSKHYAYAFYVDENLNVISDVYIKDFTTELPSTDAKYEDYLGQWQMGTDMLTISAKVNGSTYNVTGIKNMANIGLSGVEAEFSNGFFVIKEQDIVSGHSYGSYGVCDFVLGGKFYAGKEYLGYPVNNNNPGSVIFTGEYDKDTMSITVTPGKWNGNYAYTSMAIAWVTSDGGVYAGTGTTLGNMTKYEDTIPSELLGTYVCPEATEGFSSGAATYTNWTWVVKKEGTGIAIEGYDVSLDEICVANKLQLCVPVLTWDKSTSTLTLPDNSETGLSSGGVAIVWRGILDGHYDDTVWDVDLDAGTITLACDGFQARNSGGAYSYFNAPLVFTKTSSAPASVKSTGKPHASGLSVESSTIGYPASQIAPASEKVFGIQKRVGIKK